MNLTKFEYIHYFVHVYVTCMFQKDQFNSSKNYAKIRNWYDQNPTQARKIEKQWAGTDTIRTQLQPLKK